MRALTNQRRNLIVATRNITAERLWALLNYDDKTGIFTWRESRGRTAKINAQAGSVSDGYIKIMIDGKTYPASNLAFLYMTGVWPANEVDHRDTNRSNNSWENLRDIPHRTNTENQRKARTTNLTGFLGVSAHHRSNRFRARIRVDGKLKQLGWFDTPEEAHQAYVTAKRMLHDGNTL